MELPARQPTKLRPRVDLRPEQFRKILFQRGLQVSWEQAAQCPCRRKSSDLTTGFSLTSALPTGTTSAEPRVDCVICKGKGHLYHSKQTIKTVVTKATDKPQMFGQFGEYARGMVSFTLLPEHVPGFWDRFTILDTTHVYRETRKRTANVVEEARFPIVLRSLDLETGITQIGLLHVIRSSVNGEVTANDTLTVGTDLVITAEGKIDWTLGIANGKAPVEGSHYSVAYYANPRYVIVDYPYASRDTYVKTKQATATFTPLVVNAMARLEFLADGGTE